MLDFFKGTVTPKDWAFVAGILTVAAIACAGFYFFLYTPQLETIATKQTQLDEVMKTLQKARETKAKIEERRKEAQQWEQLVEMFQQRLPEEREIPALLQKFEALGDELGLRLELSQMPTSREKNKERIPYQVVARGTFHQIVTFINLLEREQRYLMISDLEINEEEEGVSEATFTLSTFRFLQTEPPQTAEKPAEKPSDGPKAT